MKSIHFSQKEFLKDYSIFQSVDYMHYDHICDTCISKIIQLKNQISGKY